MSPGQEICAGRITRLVGSFIFCIECFGFRGWVDQLMTPEQIQCFGFRALIAQLMTPEQILQRILRDEGEDWAIKPWGNIGIETCVPSIVQGIDTHVLSSAFLPRRSWHGSGASMKLEEILICLGTWPAHAVGDGNVWSCRTRSW